MTAHPVDRALALWTAGPPRGQDGLDAFRAVYADPLLVNGTSTAVTALVDRAGVLRRAFRGFGHEVLHRVDTPGHSAFAFRLFGDHIGPLMTPLGELPPTNLHLTIAGMDMFTIVDDHVTEVWAIADYLDLLINAGAIAMSTGDGRA